MKKILIPMLVSLFTFALIFTSNQAVAAEKKTDDSYEETQLTKGSSPSATKYRYIKSKSYVSMKKSASSSSKTITKVPYGHRVTYLGTKGSYTKVSFYNVMDKKTFKGYIKTSSLAKNMYVYYDDVYKAFMKWRGMTGKVYYSMDYIGPYTNDGYPLVLITSNSSKSSGRKIYMYFYTDGAVRRVEFNGVSKKYDLTPAGKWFVYGKRNLAYKQSSKKYRVLEWTSSTEAKLVTKTNSRPSLYTLTFKKK